MPKYTVIITVPVEAVAEWKNVEAPTPEAAIGAVREHFAIEEFSRLDYQIDDDLAGDPSFRAEFDADVTEAEQLGHFHKLQRAAPAMLEVLKHIRTAPRDGAQLYADEIEAAIKLAEIGPET